MVERKMEEVEDVGWAFQSEQSDPEGIVVSPRVVKLSLRSEVDPPGATPAQILGNQNFSDSRRRAH